MTSADPFPRTLRRAFRSFPNRGVEARGDPVSPLTWRQSSASSPAAASRHAPSLGVSLPLLRRPLGNTAAAAATDPARSKTGGRNPCPGSPAACGEHISAQQEALKLAERATHQGTVPLASLTRGQAYENRRQEGSLGICCCDCCCLINQSCLGVLRPSFWCSCAARSASHHHVLS